MQPCSDCWAARRLLQAEPPSPADSIDAQRAHLERVLGATTTALFVASVTYMALSTLYACLRAPRAANAPPGSNDDGPAPATREDTKRALQGIPVRVVVLLLQQQQHSPDDADGGRTNVAAQEGDQEADGDECAVCLAEYAAGDEVRVLPACRHGFHRECVDRWLLTRAPTCPVCRSPLAAPVQDADAGKDDCATGHGGVGGADRSLAIPAA
jgi:hypothetical protein